MKAKVKRKSWKQEAMAIECEKKIASKGFNEAIDALRVERNTNARLREDNENLVQKNQILMEQRARSLPRTTVDPTAEVVMSMKKAMEHSINTSAALLDSMGELVDQVSGRKERRERERRDGITIPQ